MQEEVNARGVDFRQKSDQILQAAAEAINAPSHNHVEFALRCGLVKGIEGRALISALGATA